MNRLRDVAKEAANGVGRVSREWLGRRLRGQGVRGVDGARRLAGWPAQYGVLDRALQLVELLVQPTDRFPVCRLECEELRFHSSHFGVALAEVRFELAGARGERVQAVAVRLV